MKVKVIDKSEIYYCTFIEGKMHIISVADIPF